MSWYTLLTQRHVDSIVVIPSQLVVKPCIYWYRMHQVLDSTLKGHYPTL